MTALPLCFSQQMNQYQIGSECAIAHKHFSTSSLSFLTAPLHGKRPISQALSSFFSSQMGPIMAVGKPELSLFVMQNKTGQSGSTALNCLNFRPQAQ